jgi:hypothetical protein
MLRRQDSEEFILKSVKTPLRKAPPTRNWVGSQILFSHHHHHHPSPLAGVPDVQTVLRLVTMALQRPGEGDNTTPKAAAERI